MIEEPLLGIIGHRGAQDKALENTKAAFKDALKIGITWIETDLQLSQDGEWYLWHDKTLQRQFGIDKSISGLNTAYLQELKTNSQESLCSLDELILLYEDSAMQLNLEIKSYEKNSTRLIAAAKQLLNKWPKTIKLPLITSFDHSIVRNLSDSHPSSHLAFITSEPDIDLVKEAARRNHYGIVMESSIFTDMSQLLTPYTEHLHFMIYTANDLKAIRNLFSLGASSIFTDSPAAFIQKLGA